METTRMNVKFVHYCYELIAIKKLIEQLQHKEKMLKKKLEPFVSPGDPLVLSEAVIECIEPRRRHSFCRVDVLNFIKERFGKDFANEVDVHCTKINHTSKHLRVKLKSYSF